jgi:hypothetical protein
LNVSLSLMMEALISAETSVTFTDWHGFMWEDLNFSLPLFFYLWFIFCGRLLTDVKVKVNVNFTLEQGHECPDGGVEV